MVWPLRRGKGIKKIQDTNGVRVIFGVSSCVLFSPIVMSIRPFQLSYNQALV